MRDDLNRRIIIIDDNRAIHDDFRKILSAQANGSEYGAESAEFFGDSPEQQNFVGFEIDDAFQGQEGLEQVKQSLAAGRPYGVAFIDVRMPPGWDGIETTARIWEICPELQVVICTAYSDYDWDGIVRKLGQTDRLLILKKPFDTVEVLQLAMTLAQKWTSTRQAALRLADLDAMVNQRTQELRATNEKLTQEIAAHSRSQEQLRQSQKLEAIGQLAGGVAHDFNNLLAVIGGNAGLALMEIPPSSTRVIECLQEINAASDRAADLTRQLLAFSRKQMMQSQPVNLDDIIRNLSKMLNRIIGENIELRCDYTPELPPVQADAGMIEQVLVNLVVNARDAMPEGGRLLITTEQLVFGAEPDPSHPEARSGNFVCLTVQDTGAGISQQILPRIFDPFFTTKEVGKGTGLGLATVYGIVKQHQGWIEASSQVGAGATFKIYLPALECAVPAAVSLVTPQPEPPRGRETVLLVEDEQAVRSVTRLLLERSGYRVLEAGSGPEALKIWESAAPDVDLLLTDVIMPEGVHGRKLAEELLGRKNSLKVIFQSGYGGEIMRDSNEFLRRTNSYFLQKPCAPRDLICTVRRCLDGLPAHPEHFPAGS